MSEKSRKELVKFKGYGFNLPNLPKQDYFRLKERCGKWEMSMVQMVLLGLRGIDHLPDEVVRKLTDQVLKDV